MGKTYTKTILCLANSWKHGGRCVAGREVARTGYGPWIRPISDRAGAELSDQDREYRDGSDPALLDIIELSLLEPRPYQHQVENHLLDAKKHWIKKGRASWKDLEAALEEPSRLWRNGRHSSNGINDSVSASKLDKLDASLYLIRPTRLSVIVATDSYNGKRKVRAHFEYADEKYRLVITDPVFNALARKKLDGTYKVVDAILCISLAEPLDGTAYKVVAAVFRRRR